LGVNLFPEPIQEVEITFVSPIRQQTAARNIGRICVREPYQTPKHLEHSRGQDLGYDCHVVGVGEIRLFGALFQGIHCRRGLEVQVTVVDENLPVGRCPFEHPGPDVPVVGLGVAALTSFTDQTTCPNESDFAVNFDAGVNGVDKIEVRGLDNLVHDHLVHRPYLLSREVELGKIKQSCHCLSFCWLSFHAFGALRLSILRPS